MINYIISFLIAVFIIFFFCSLLNWFALWLLEKPFCWYADWDVIHTMFSSMINSKTRIDKFCNGALFVIYGLILHVFFAMGILINVHEALKD